MLTEGQADLGFVNLFKVNLYDASLVICNIFVKLRFISPALSQQYVYDIVYHIVTYCKHLTMLQQYCDYIVYHVVNVHNTVSHMLTVRCYNIVKFTPVVTKYG